MGQHVQFVRGANDALREGDEEGVVGEVELLRDDGAVIRIGSNQAVQVGDSVELTSRGRTSTTLAPAAPSDVVRLELQVGTFLRVPGVIGDARVTFHRRSAYAFASMPSSVFIAARERDGVSLTSNSGLQGMVGGGLQQRFFSLGLSLGVVQARRDTFAATPASAAPSLGTHLRLGALDGLSFSTDLTLAVGRHDQRAVYRMDFGAFVPFSSRVLLGLNGGTWLTGQSYSDLHISLRARVHGSGGPGSWYVRGAVSFLWLREVNLSGGYYGYYEDSRGATLGFQLGLEHRFGVGRRATTPSF